METACPKIERIPGTNLPLKDREPTREINIRLPGAFHNDIDPCKHIKNEKAVHRKMQSMWTEGYTFKEIAEYTGYAASHVSEILRQPYARLNMINEIKNSVQEEMRSFLEAEVLPTLRVLKDIRDDETAKKSDRIAASAHLLDRFLGKPTQPIEEKKFDPTKLSDNEITQQAIAIIESERRTETANSEGVSQQEGSGESPAVGSNG